MIAIRILFSLVLSTQASRVVETSAAFRAKLWLKSHDPSADEAGMNDLKNSDPNAFAIVQALLTKKSLGLLDPNHPTAAFGGGGLAPKKRKSFQEEAADEGLTQDAPSPEISQMEMRSSMPYPTAGHTQDQWNHKTMHSDDDILNSVLGGEAAAPAQTESDTLSLSAVTQQEQQQKPAPVATPLTSNGMPSLNWGNPMAGQSADTSAAVGQPTNAESGSEDQSLSLSAVRSQEERNLGIREPAPMVEQQAASAPVEEVRSPLENSQLGLPSLSWNRDAQASLAAVAAPVVVPRPVPAAANSYLTGSDLSSSTAGMDAQSAAQKKLEMSTFHARMSSYGSSYRMNLHANDPVPTSDSILALRNQNMGNSYNSFLKQARTNRWKRAMDVTLNMKPMGPVGAKNAYLQDLS